MSGDAAEDVTRGVGEGVEDVGRAVDDVVSGGDNETQKSAGKRSNYTEWSGDWHSKYALLLLPYLKNFPLANDICRFAGKFFYCQAHQHLV